MLHQTARREAAWQIGDRLFKGGAVDWRPVPSLAAGHPRNDQCRKNHQVAGEGDRVGRQDWSWGHFPCFSLAK